MLLAIAALGFAALFALPPIISDCSESRLPKLGIAALLLVLWAAAGVFVTIMGSTEQRTVLFLGVVFILFGYGYGLSQVLPVALRPVSGC